MSLNGAEKRENTAMCLVRIQFIRATNGTRALSRMELIV